MYVHYSYTAVRVVGSCVYARDVIPVATEDFIQRGMSADDCPVGFEGFSVQILSFLGAGELFPSDCRANVIPVPYDTVHKRDI